MTTTSSQKGNPMNTYRVEVSDCFNGPRRWITVEAESMTLARAKAKRGKLVSTTFNGPRFYVGGVYDTHTVQTVTCPSCRPGAAQGEGECLCGEVTR